jgi:hypothetical protein
MRYNFSLKAYELTPETRSTAEQRGRAFGRWLAKFLKFFMESLLPLGFFMFMSWEFNKTHDLYYGMWAIIFLMMYGKTSK